MFTYARMYVVILWFIIPCLPLYILSLHRLYIHLCEDVRYTVAHITLLWSRHIELIKLIHLMCGVMIWAVSPLSSLYAHAGYIFTPLWLGWTSSYYDIISSLHGLNIYLHSYLYLFINSCPTSVWTRYDSHSLWVGGSSILAAASVPNHAIKSLAGGNFSPLCKYIRFVENACKKAIKLGSSTCT